MKLTINKVSINTKIQNAAASKVAFAYNAARTRFMAAKRKFLEEFDNHPVNQELSQGEDLQSSAFLAYEGNLFSFIGFLAGDKPVLDLRSYLNSYLEMNKQPIRIDKNSRAVVFHFGVSLPSRDEFEENFPYPDGTIPGSWVIDIERSIDGIAQYIFYTWKKNPKKFNADVSRSTTAIQVEEANSANVFSPMAYVPTMIKEFAAEF